MRVRPSSSASISAVMMPAESPSVASTLTVLSTDAPSESARLSCCASSSRIAAKSRALGVSAGAAATATRDDGSAGQ